MVFRRGNGSYEKKWKNQFFQDNAFCIPPPNGKLSWRSEEAERIPWKPRLPARRKKAAGRADSRDGVTFFLASGYFQMSYFSKVSKEDPLPVSSLHLGFETYRKQGPFPWPLFFLSKFNLDTESWRSRGWSLLQCLQVGSLPRTGRNWSCSQLRPVLASEGYCLGFWQVV